MVALLAQAGKVSLPSLDWGGLLPVILPAAGAVLLLTIRSLLPRLPSGFNSIWAFASATAGFVAVCIMWGRVNNEAPIGAFGSEFISDKFSLFVAAVILASAAAVSLLLPHFCERVGISGGVEIYVLLLLSAVGGVVMAGSGDLIVLFLGLETLSIALYVMAAFNRHRLASIEAGIKYFILGSFSSAFLLYGIAMLYSTTGSVNLGDIDTFFEGFVVVRDGILLAGMAMLLVGLGFKIATVPFHAWVPDVYQAAPTPVTAFMASAVKAAAFAALIKVFVVALKVRAHDWQPAFFVLSCATLLVGAILAVVQNNVKRILAYSSISHAGFILVGVQLASSQGIAAVLFYSAAYSAIAVGSFAVLSMISGSEDDHTDLNDLIGLGARRPVLSLAFTVLLFAQAGIPLTSGFMAKLYVISSAVEARSYPLAIVAIVSAVIAAFAYLRVVAAMYFTNSNPESLAGGDVPVGGGDAEVVRSDHLSVGAVVVILVAVGVTLFAGMLPGVLASLADDASQSLSSFIP